MKLIFAIGILMLGAGCASSKPLAKDDRPMPFALRWNSLQQNKLKIEAKDADILPAYQALIKDAEKALKAAPTSVIEKLNNPPSGDKHDYMSLAPYHWPDPAKADGLPYIRKDGETNPEVRDYKDKDYMPKLCANVQSLGLAYYFSGEEMYAQQAAKLVRIWFLDDATRMNPNLNFAQAIKGVNDGRGAGLIDSRHYIKLIDGIQLIRPSKYFTAADLSGMQAWFSSFLQWMQSSKVGLDEMKAKNNHGAWYDAQRLSIALFVNDMPQAKNIVQSALSRLDVQMNDEGLFPKELERTTSLHYSTFVMEAFLNIAQMSEKTGIDFWNATTPSGKNLALAFNALLPYLQKTKTWTLPQIKPFEDEEAYFILMDGAAHYKCTSCKKTVQQLAGEKADRLRIKLLY